MNKVLVTGADGFIGSHLTELLIEKGVRVKALAYYNSFNYWGWLEDIPSNPLLEIVTGDIRDPHFVRNIMHDVDTVFHLAALIAIPYSYNAPGSYVDTNIIGTLNVCQAAREFGGIRVLNTSTSEVYGTAQYVPIDERHPKQPQSPYSATKIGADAIAMSFYNAFDVPVTTVRPFNTYGPRQSARAVIPTIITQIVKGQKEIHAGDLSPTRDFIFVKDTCRGFLALAESNESVGKEVNVSTNTEISIGEVFNLIKGILHSDLEFVSDYQRMRPENSEVFRLKGDNTLIKQITGFIPEYTISEGLEVTCEWFGKKKTWLNTNLIYIIFNLNPVNKIPGGMNYKIPLFDLNFDEKEEQAVLNVLRSKWISTGPKTTEFENRFAELLKVDHALAMANCSVALHLAMKLAGVGPDDEVICPSLTFVASVNAIRYVGATPVFADITSYHTLTIDPDDIERKISEKTKVILVMHYGGYACDMGRIMAIANKYKIKVVEDACHGPLSEYNNRKLGTIGDIGCFSFFSNKNISTGEGGMLVTNNRKFYERAKLLRSHGMTSLSYERAKGHSTSYDVVDLGYNYRMDDIRAAIGLVQLEKIEKDLLRRVEIRKIYMEYLAGIEEVIIPFQNYPHFSSNYIFTIVIKNSTIEKRELIRARMFEKGIQTSVHYPAVHRFSVYSGYSCSLPKTEYIADNLITLPMYSSLTRDKIKQVVKSLKSSIIE